MLTLKPCIDNLIERPFRACHSDSRHDLRCRSRAIVFERDKLSKFFRNEAEVAGIIYQLLGRELANKIKVSNTLISTANSLA